MVEPDYSGALVTDYLGRYGLLEVVEGLGTSLEKKASQNLISIFSMIKSFWIPELRTVRSR